MQVTVCPACKDEVTLAEWCAVCGLCVSCCACEENADDGWDLSDMEDDRYFWDR